MTEHKRNQNLRFKKAQTVTELAIFGTVLMFILGIIVRQAHNAQLGQNQAYRAMRMALTQSYIASLKEEPNRNSSTVLIIEDRLSPSAEKYGPTSRFPLIVSGSGTHSRELFQPQTYGVVSELPRLDIFVNGQHFPLIVAGYKNLTGLDSNISSPEWDPQCAYRYLYNAASGNLDILQWMGCMRFFRIIPNYMKDEEKNLFCCYDGTPAQCDLQYSLTAEGVPIYDCRDTPTKRCCDVDKNLNVMMRFDLNRDPAVNPPSETALLASIQLRSNFAWQWYLVKGFDPDRSQDMDAGVNGPEPRPFEINFGESLIIYNDPDNSEKNRNTFLDVDRDFKEETVLEGAYNGSGVISTLKIIDYQEGDIDTAYNKLSTGPEPGLLEDVHLFSFTQEGTYLLLREGRLYSPITQQYVRNVQKRDRVDVVQRALQLSNNTGRFCDPVTFARQPTVDGGPNSVEVCSDNCFDQANVDQTCYDVTKDVIYIRSRIKDLGGRKWITKVP